jgi:hypothetical protein
MGWALVQPIAFASSSAVLDAMRYYSGGDVEASAGETLQSTCEGFRLYGPKGRIKMKKRKKDSTITTTKKKKKNNTSFTTIYERDVFSFQTRSHVPWIQKCP